MWEAPGTDYIRLLGLRAGCKEVMKAACGKSVARVQPLHPIARHHRRERRQEAQLHNIVSDSQTDGASVILSRRDRCQEAQLHSMVSHSQTDNTAVICASTPLDSRHCCRENNMETQLHNMASDSQTDNAAVILFFHFTR